MGEDQALAFVEGFECLALVGVEVHYWAGFELLSDEDVWLVVGAHVALPR